MNRNVRIRINTPGMDVAQQDQHQEPELRPVMGAFRFQGHHRAAGKIAGFRAVFGGQIARKSVKIARGHAHGQSMAGADEQGLNPLFIPSVQMVTHELHARFVICYIPRPTDVDFACEASF